MSTITVVIKIKNIESGKSRIHRMTDFLFEYINNQPKYVTDIADDIVRFLNYIYFDLNYKELKSIRDLNIDIGASFLEGYCHERTKKTVLRMERNLNNFYYFLAKRCILDSIHVNDFKIVYGENNTQYKESLFKGKYRLNNNTRELPRPIHQFDAELIFLFMDKAKEVAPHIALGIYMQVFGGLRISEVISLSYSDLIVKGPDGANGLIVDLRKNSDLRKDLKHSGLTSSKKERRQMIIGIPSILPEIYKEHIKKYKSEASNSIFVNKKNEALTKEMYRYYFTIVKNSFLDSLINSSSSVLKAKGIFLKSQRWSTHIGRGLFSNLVANSSRNIVELATARGDSNLDSSLPYIADIEDVEKNIIEVMNKYYITHLNTKYN